MEKNLNEELFEKDISIEEFDHITDGVEDHIFSDRYLAGKEKMMKTYTQKKKAKMTGIFPKVAVAAATVLVLGTPFAVNAATNGALFASLLVTDISSLSSVMLVAAEEKFLSAVNFPKQDEHIYFLKDVVSRKKQLIPMLSEILATYGS